MISDRWVRNIRNSRPRQVDKYIEANVQLEPFFKRSKNAKEQLFLVANSAYHFV